MSKTNTLRTIVTYAGTLIAKQLGLRRGRPEIEAIFNYVPISEALATSGQPTEAQFAAIRDAGFDTVINLLPREKENALKNEAEVVSALGLDYAYIPVDFKAPKEADYANFKAAMAAHDGRKVWVHCAVNARVSVFVARYRHEVLGEPQEAARAHIGKVWEPIKVWSEFLEGRETQ
ncbi:MAG: protein tyrosine phosphatase family protein [Pseudomonadota bacterium]